MRYVLSPAAFALFTLPLPIASMVSIGRPGVGIIGYGIKMYDPPCAEACARSATWPLDCGDHDMGDMGDMEGMEGMSEASPECKANSDPFLQTVAYCMSVHCGAEVKISKIERYWEMDLFGRLVDQPTPKMSYQQALKSITALPTTVVDSEAMLETVSLIDEELWQTNWNAFTMFEHMEVLHSRYGIVLFSTCVLIPIFLSLLSLLPFPPALVSKFYAYVVDPPVFGRYHAVPVLGLGFIPTRGQALFVLYLWGINLILSSVGYALIDPMNWYASLSIQTASYISNRTGIHSFVNIGIAILFSSRNNLLLYLTNWSHATFLLAHRWLAVIAMLQACLHSAIYWKIYGASDATMQYWIWGIVSTMSLVLLIPFSLIQIRQKFYEAFLAIHIVLALFALIGGLLHIWYRFGWQWGYGVWLAIAFAIWSFDRFLARPFRLARNGVKKAIITVIDEDYLMSEVPGVEAEGHAYLYFPTLTWRVWENHPFSIAGVLGRTQTISSESESKRSISSSSGEDKDTVLLPHSNADAINACPAKSPRLVLFLRVRGGLTTQLAKRANLRNGIPVLIESSYGSEQTSLIPSPSSRPSLEFPNLICIAGGVGITAVLPILNRAGGLFAPSLGKIKLFWGVRTEPLVRCIEDVLGQEQSHSSLNSGKTSWGKVNVAVSVGARFNFPEILKAELRGMEGGTTVVVCGPPGMADEVRVNVASLGQKGFVVRFIEESFLY